MTTRSNEGENSHRSPDAGAAVIQVLGFELPGLRFTSSGLRLLKTHIAFLHTPLPHHFSQRKIKAKLVKKSGSAFKVKLS